MPLLDSYNQKLTQILPGLLPDVHISYDKPKVIHDHIWGSHLFYPWEMRFLDTPMCQRLRQIYQLGTAFLTYPSAVHTRFSHSLGVAILAGRLITRLKEKAEITSQEISITEKNIYTVRLAGLLHDIGHCFFSHASEKIIGPIIRPLISEVLPNAKPPKPHEFIAFLIITHPYFKEFYLKHVAPLFHNPGSTPELDDIAKIIIGIYPNGHDRFLQEIISGPYDVDKLEYLYRDAEMAGLEISYDIERYFYKINLHYSPGEGHWRLVMDQGGVQAVEQIIFSKMMLFSFVYHHHKVLLTDAIIGDLLYELIRPGETGLPSHLLIDHPLDFLKYTDADIFSSQVTTNNITFNRLRSMITSRDLPKRCLVLNSDFIIGLKNDSFVKFGWDKLKATLRGDPERINEFRSNFVQFFNAKYPNDTINELDIFISMPDIPKTDEQAQAPVLNIDNEIESMSEFFYDLDSWKKTYELKKLRGFFFCTELKRETVAGELREYIAQVFKIKLKDAALKEAKLSKNSRDSTVVKKN